MNLFTAVIYYGCMFICAAGVIVTACFAGSALRKNKNTKILKNSDND